MGVRRVARKGWLLAGVACVLAVVSACSSPARISAIGLANQTGLSITLTVNDAFVATYPAGARADISLDPAPARFPWRLELWIEGTDHQLLNASIDSEADSGISSSMSTCGVVTLWWGDAKPSLLPDPSPLQSQDCR